MSAADLSHISRSTDWRDRRVADEYLSGYSRQLRESSAEAEARCDAPAVACGGGLDELAPAWPSVPVADDARAKLRDLMRGDVRDAATAAADHCHSMHIDGRAESALRAHCEAWGVSGPVQDGGSAVARMCCRSWWARKLRRASRRVREYGAMGSGRVSRYCSLGARREYVRGQEDSRRWAESTKLTRWDSGESWTMAQLIASSTANPEVRAAELITRVKGCAEYAEGRGLVGVLVTLTAPGSMHVISGDRWDGSSPVDVQARLARNWARFRAMVWRDWNAADRPFGVRVVEPHRDGCPHWHMVLFLPAGRVDALRDGLMRYYLGPGPHRPADLAHRVKVDLVTGGADGAVAYVIKYVVKHTGSVGGREVRALAGDDEIPDAKTADTMAVNVWASIWGMRTWQAVGGPPVTVWRALRRVEGLGSDGYVAPVGPLGAAIIAADCGEWSEYVRVQGVARTGKRWPVSLSMSSMRRESVGGTWYSADATRYGDGPAKVAVGILAITGTDGPCSVYVRRYRWVAAGRGFSPLGHVSITVRGEDGGSMGVAGSAFLRVDAGDLGGVVLGEGQSGDRAGPEYGADLSIGGSSDLGHVLS